MIYCVKVEDETVILGWWVVRHCPGSLGESEPVSMRMRTKPSIHFINIISIRLLQQWQQTVVYAIRYWDVEQLVIQIVICVGYCALIWLSSRVARESFLIERKICRNPLVVSISSVAFMIFVSHVDHHSTL